MLGQERRPPATRNTFISVLPVISEPCASCHHIGEFMSPFTPVRESFVKTLAKDSVFGVVRVGGELDEQGQNLTLAHPS